MGLSGVSKQAEFLLIFWGDIFQGIFKNIFVHFINFALTKPRNIPYFGNILITD